MAEHDQTLRFYADNAKAYAGYREKANEIRLEAFLSRLSPGPLILELGCGNGRDSGFMIERGFDVTPTDGVAEMAEQASRRLGRRVALLRFGISTALLPIVASGPMPAFCTRREMISPISLPASTGRCALAAFSTQAIRPARKR